MKYEEIGKGIVKRTERRQLGVFIDGTGLDRATRRISRKVDMSALLKGVSSGMLPAVARYYTLIPYEDDSRQRAFLDAVSKAGFHVVVKRLPPKGVTRQVSVDVEMGCDMVAFALGHTQFSALSLYSAEESFSPPSSASNSEPTHASRVPGMFPVASSQVRLRLQPSRAKAEEAPKANESARMEQALAPGNPSANAASPAPPGVSPKNRIVTVVCPSRDLAYPISLVRELGVDTVTADFGQFNTGDILKSAAKWVDLSDSETIWRE